MSDRPPHLIAGAGPAPADCLERPTAAFQGGDFGPRHNLHIGQPGDAVDEIARHARLEAPSAHDQPYFCGLTREVHRRLARGVAGADQGHLLRGAQLRFQGRRPIVHARSLEGVEVRDIEPAIARPAGNDDRTRHCVLIVGQRQSEAASVCALQRLEAHHLVGDRHFDAEFLRLIVGARHQRNAADAGWKAEIILDAGRRARLAAERTTVEHQGGKPFRSCIDAGREPGRSGADDRNVIEQVRIDRSHQPDAAGQFDLARIPQHLSARAQHDRKLAGIDLKTLDERPRLGIGLRVERLARVAVAAQEAFQPQHIAVVGASDDHRPADARLEQADPAQDQRAHDPLAKFGFGDQQGTKPVRRNDQRFHCVLRMRVDQRGPARQLRELAHECAGAVRHDEVARVGVVAPDDLDLAAQDDDQARPDLARAADRLSGGIVADLSEPAHPLDLGRLQNGEDLGSSRVQDRVRAGSHCYPVSFAFMTDYPWPEW